MIVVENLVLSDVPFYCVMKYSEKRGIAIACLSVRNIGGSGPRGLEILETNYLNNYPKIFALCIPHVIHPVSGEHMEILGRLEVGWKKVTCLSTKAAISLKRVKIEEKLLWMAYRNSPSLFRTVPSSTPTSSSSPRLGFATPTQNFNRYYLRNGSRYWLQIQPLHPQGPSEQKPFKSLEKRGACALEYPLLSQERESYELQILYAHSYRIDRNESPFTICLSTVGHQKC